MTTDEARLAGKKILAVIDGKSVYYRGYYAMPNLTTSDGQPTGGVYGFASLALELVRHIHPDYVAVAWDKPHTNIRRRKAIYDGYKSNRHPAPPDFYAQIPTLMNLLSALNWPLYQYDDYEADDIMGTLSDKANAVGIHTVLISSDLDMLQLIDDDTEVYAMKKGLRNLEKFDVNAFEAKYGLHVSQFLDLKSLKGDSSDCIPGVPGVGEKTGIKLLQKYQTLDGVYGHINEITGSLHDKLVKGKDSAYMSKELAKIWRDAPVPLDLEAMDVRKLDITKLRQVLTDLQFTSLLRKVSEILAPYSAKSENVSSERTNASLIASGKEQQPAELTRESSSARPKYSPLPLQPNAAIVYLADDSVFVLRDDKVAELTANEAADYLAGKMVIAHDIKTLTEYLLSENLPINYMAAWDTRHAAFLINSRIKPKTLDDIRLERGIDDSPKNCLDLVRTLYAEQSTKMQEMPEMLSLARKVDFPLQIVLARIENRGMLLDPNILHEQSAAMDDEIESLRRDIYAQAGEEFNVASAKQLSHILFDVMKLPPVGKKGTQGAYSTSAKVLDKLAPNYPIAALIERYRELTKLKSTYLDALPQSIAGDGRIHTTFDQDVTSTGRLSSSSPNLQNIPTRSTQGHMIKRAFVAPAGRVIVNADYAQFELRLAAALAHDEDMIQMFADPKNDIHTMTAAQAYGIEPEDVTSEQRRHAKVINFGILYGMSAKGLSDATGMDMKQASDFIKKYFAARQPIKDYLDATLNKARTLGYVETLFGRRRYTPDVKLSNPVMRAAAERAAMNMPIQGTEADLMKMAMLKVENITGASQIMQVHDSIMVECAETDAEQIAREMKDIMENVYPEIGVYLLVDVKYGHSWAEL